MSSTAKNTAPLFPRVSLHPATLARADALANDDRPWCVAFSGGADSLALLLAVRENFPRQKLVALHFNHHLRGAASDGDEQFCRAMCVSLGVELRVDHWRHANTVASEAEARDARHAFFIREMSALKSRALFLGHQLDDIAETQLMRLARGSSTAGLAAPRPVHAHADGRTFLRPLLTLSKKQITDALRSRGVTWCEDATNTAPASDASGDFFRNRIRRDVLPAWVAAAENDALAGAALTRELLDEDAAALDAWLDELLRGNEGGIPGLPENALDLRPLAGKPRALFRRALRRWPPAAELARAGFETLLAMCEKTSAAASRTSIGGHTAIFENGVLRLQPPASNPPPYSIALAIEKSHATSATLPDGSRITAGLVQLTADLRTQILTGKFDPINTIFISTPDLPTGLFLRPWKHGDRYQPLGAPGAAKVSDLFINRKIPQSQRLTLPVVCTSADPDAEILWIPGLPPAHGWKINQKTPLALHLTYQCGTCTVHPQSIKS